MTWALVALQFACGVLLLLTFIASRSSRRSIWSLLMLLAVMGILLFGALAYLDPLLPYF
jgi:bacteriorhodopsin